MKLLLRSSGPALPFSGAAGGAGVTCRVLEGASPIPIALGVFPWRLQGALRLTVIAKASFSFTGDPPAAGAITPDPLQNRDVHHKHQPMAHVTAASDRAPWKTAVDVTLLGHAHAREPAAEVRARLALRDAGGAVLLDKVVRVVGDRLGRGRDVRQRRFDAQQPPHGILPDAIANPQVPARDRRAMIGLDADHARAMVHRQRLHDTHGGAGNVQGAMALDDAERVGRRRHPVTRGNAAVDE